MRLATIIALLILAGCSASRSEDTGMPAISLEDQLTRLDECGISLQSGITIEDLLFSWDRSDYEATPFVLVLVAMGSNVEKPPYPRFSDDVWYFDTECIGGNGDYVAIAERITDLVGGGLELSELYDKVDIEAGIAWLTFKVGDQVYEWDLRVDNDWVDPEVFVLFEQVLEKHTPGLRQIYFNPGGQSCLFLVGDSKRLERLRVATGLEFIWAVQ